MSFKLNFDPIRSPKIVDRNTIVGQLHDGAEVKVERILDAWKICLRITVGGFVQHDAEVTSQQERDEFAALRARARDDADDAIEADRSSAKLSGAILFK